MAGQRRKVSMSCAMGVSGNRDMWELAMMRDAGVRPDRMERRGRYHNCRRRDLANMGLNGAGNGAGAGVVSFVVVVVVVWV